MDDTAAYLVALCDLFAEQTGQSVSTVSRRATGSGDTIARLRPRPLHHHAPGGAYLPVSLRALAGGNRVARAHPASGAAAGPDEPPEGR